MIIYAPENIKVFAQTFVCVFSYLARVCEVSLIVKMLATDVENTEKRNVIETTWGRAEISDPNFYLNVQLPLVTFPMKVHYTTNNI